MHASISLMRILDCGDWPWLGAKHRSGALYIVRLPCPLRSAAYDPGWPRSLTYHVRNFVRAGAAPRPRRCDWRSHCRLRGADDPALRPSWTDCDHEGQPFAAAGCFTIGYLLAWSGFSFVAAVAQWGLERAMLLTPAMHIASKGLGGTILVVAGLYQWSPLKCICLSQCQAPLLFIHRYGGFRADASGALLMGLRHGAYCVGCCWALMALLFIGGVMNLVWIALIAVLVLIEKIVPSGHRFGQLAGAFLIMAGPYLLGQ